MNRTEESTWIRLRPGDLELDGDPPTALCARRTAKARGGDHKSVVIVSGGQKAGRESSRCPCSASWAAVAVPQCTLLVPGRSLRLCASSPVIARQRSATRRVVGARRVHRRLRRRRMVSERGDLYRADRGAAAGSRPAKRRPVLVLQAGEHTRQPARDRARCGDHFEHCAGDDAWERLPARCRNRTSARLGDQRDGSRHVGQERSSRSGRINTGQPEAGDRSRTARS